MGNVDDLSRGREPPKKTDPPPTKPSTAATPSQPDEAEPAPTVSKALFLGIIGGSFGFALLPFFYGYFAYQGGEVELSDLGDALGLELCTRGLSLPAGIALLVLLYKAWKVIPAAHARTTPGRAVGFLFIPCFNLYWIFQAFYGWAQD